MNNDSFVTTADPDGNVIFELNKPEIDDAHKDKQKMFNENFKVRPIIDYNARQIIGLIIFYFFFFHLFFFRLKQFFKRFHTGAIT